MRWLRRSPAICAVAITAAFFLFTLVVLRPGYWINDDLKFIWNIVGYPGKPALTPFIICSNILLGLLLAPLYSLPTSINWMVVLLSLVNAGAICGYLYLVIASAASRLHRLIGVTVILAVTSILVLNVTYTITASLAAIAGFSLILAASGQDSANWTGKMWFGIALIVTGSLIRIQMLAFALALVIPGILALGWQRNWRRVIAAVAVAGALVAGAYLFDKLYVRAFPDWNYYYAYRELRQKLHDSHRLDNLHNQGRRVGWSGNDQELFARWFYPDESLYSLDRIKYLVEHVRGTSQDPWGTLATFLGRVVQAPAAPYLACMLGVGLWAIAERRSPRILWSMLLIWGAALASNAFVAWAYKDPDYVLVSGLGGGLAFAVVLSAISGEGRVDQAHATTASSRWLRVSQAAAMLSLAVSIVVLLGQLLAASSVNVGKQAAYAGILGDLNELQSTGRISPGALIIAPAHGLPFEWSNPFELSRPAVSYFDTGWLTFSPTYFRVLREFDIQSLPEAVYERDDVYLMSEESFTPFLARYYEEHLAVSVRFEPIYAMPNPHHLAGYDGNYLFKVSPAP